MLKKTHRLSSRNAVRRASRYGDQVKYAQMSLRYISNNIGHARLAVVVSKKVSKSAVIRNKIKRRVMEAYRQNVLPRVKSSNDLVIFVHNDNILDKDPMELTKDLISLLTKSKIL